VATAIAAVRSAVTFLAISLYVLILAPPGLLVAMLFKWPGMLYDTGRFGAWLGIVLAGIRREVRGLEQVPRDRAVVFFANHQSNVDPPVLFVTLHRRLHVLFKAELLKLPLLGRVFLAGGFVPVQRENREKAMASIAEAVRSIQSGNTFLIFPEGTRSRTDELLPFKKGGFRMAIKAGAPIVPVAISGGRAAMVKGSFIIRPVTLTIRVGTPVETRDATVDQRDELIERVRQQIATLLAEGPL
jgi:1-acyl-sn-glycerol-3-phosphate acyltransferase